jgi:hypothetical protein
MTNNIISLSLRDTDTTPLNGGMILYSPVESTTFLPLVLRKEGENILVTPQDNLSEDQLVSLFGEDSVVPEVSYSFSEKELSSVFKEEPELLSEFVALLEANNEVESDKLLGLVKALVEEGFATLNVLVSLEAMSRTDLERLLQVYEDSLPLRQIFIKFLMN